MCLQAVHAADPAGRISRSDQLQYTRRLPPCIWRSSWPAAKVWHRTSRKQDEISMPYCCIAHVWSGVLRGSQNPRLPLQSKALTEPDINPTSDADVCSHGSLPGCFSRHAGNDFDRNCLVCAGFSGQYTDRSAVAAESLAAGQTPYKHHQSVVSV